MSGQGVKSSKYKVAVSLRDDIFNHEEKLFKFALQSFNLYIPAVAAHFVYPPFGGLERFFLPEAICFAFCENWGDKFVRRMVNV